MPSGTRVPRLPTNKTDYHYITQAIKYIKSKKQFKNNYGNMENFMYPVTHKSANKFLKDFFIKRFAKFGPYQDYIDKDDQILFHSFLSSSINIGLLNPHDIMIKASKKKVPINSKEGFIRQLFWRDYQRFAYIHFKFKGKNFFGNKRRLTKAWYTGNLDIPPVDDAIIDAFDTGYLHHIRRLMVVGNFMNLSGIKPSDGFKWFMEFSCDSYEWVMHQNVYDMVFCVSGGGTTTKPYLASSSYILNMSNYSRGPWAEEWSNMYRKFLKKHKKKILGKFKYFFARTYAILRI